MAIPFDMTRYEEEKLAYDVGKFMGLYVKYGNNVDEILEFADLYRRFCPIKKNRYED